MMAFSLIDSKNTQETRIPFVLTQILVGSFLIALCAQIRIPLPFTPVPITLQTLAVMLVGGFLGSRNGALSVLLYLAESMMGLPVLSGGQINTLALLSPVGGYLVGFVFQAYLTGWFFERKEVLSRSTLLSGIALSCAVDLALGAFWLGHFVGFGQSLMLGVIPFIPGEMIKILIVFTTFIRGRVSECK